MTVHVFGVRHHGPGSARSLLRALTVLQPDAVLVEGPPDAAAVLPLALHDDMRPPVALLVYVPATPRRAVFYPFASFSPEWQALRYGLASGVTTRFIDLPQAHQLAAVASQEPEGEGDQPEPPPDPIGLLAEAAGFSDGERWWERLVEQRRDDSDVFAAILEAMTAARRAAPRPDPSSAAAVYEARREAHMRRCIRTAVHEGHARIAVVCGAWHAPALTFDAADTNGAGARADAALLTRLPSVKVQATWTPWTHGRLTASSGYGAGVHSPGWYDHLWTAPDAIAIRWLTRVARLLRDEGIDVSPAHVIEATRLAGSLAALRGEPLTGLATLMEACRAVFCFGDDAPLRLIHDRLIIGETLGAVPAESPAVPLQHDLQVEQKRLRFPPEATQRLRDLDLREATDRQRSVLLHRLSLLSIPWGSQEEVRGKSGTFHELWRVQWQPELTVAMIEAGIWGNSVLAAATARTADLAGRETNLSALLALLDRSLAADLPSAVATVVARVEDVAALTGDVDQLLETLPALAQIVRYGNVRRTDTAIVQGVLDTIVPRICIGLPGACASLDTDGAIPMKRRLAAADRAIAVLQRPEHAAAWRAALLRLADLSGLHGLLAGICCRLLLDARAYTPAEAGARLGLALSHGNEPAHGAAWIEGFLEGSGLLLLHDEALWQTIDGWVTALPAEAFVEVLPLLRRTFATFTSPERHRLGERVRNAGAAGAIATAPFDDERGALVLPLLARLLGVGAAPDSLIGRDEQE